MRQALYICLTVGVLGLSAASASLVRVANSEVETLLAKGSERAEQGDLESAFENFKLAVDKDPQSVEARLKLAGMQVARGEYRDSIGNFQNVIGMQPENANAFIGMGIAYLHLGSYGLASAAFKEALSRDENKRKEIQSVLDWLDARSSSALDGQGYDAEK